MGLGSTKLVTLEEARLTAQSNKKTAKDGGDPRQLKKLQDGERLRHITQAIILLS